MPEELAYNPANTDISETDPTQSLTEDDIKQIKHRSVRGAVSYLLRTCFIQGIGFAAAAILSAYLAPADYGIYGFVLQIIGLLTFFSDIGFAAALVQKRVEPSLIEYRTAFTVQQILSWLIVVVCVILVATGFVQAKTGTVGVWLILSLAISFPLASLKTISSIKLERHLEFSKLTIPQIVEQIVFQGILIVLAIKGFGALAYAYAIMARAIVGTVIMWLLAPWQIGLAFHMPSFKGLFSFGAKFQLNDFLARIKDQLFSLVIGLWLSPTEFGYIQWSKNWSLYPYNLTVQNVLAVTFPTFSRLQHHPDLLKKAIEKSLFFISLVIFPILVGMCLIIWPVTQVIGKYGKWEPAVISFVFFTLSIIGAAVSTPLTNTLNALGKINDSLKLMVLWTILTWVITPLAMRFYGFNGVALASFIISLTSILPVFMLKKYVSFNSFEPIWRQSVASLAMAVVGLLGMSYWAKGLTYLAIGAGVMGLTYVVTLLLVGYRKLRFELMSVIH